LKLKKHRGRTSREPAEKAALQMQDGAGAGSHLKPHDPGACHYHRRPGRLSTRDELLIEANLGRPVLPPKAAADPGGLHAARKKTSRLVSTTLSP
jgi:hypothetical protein